MSIFFTDAGLWSPAPLIKDDEETFRELLELLIGEAPDKEEAILFVVVVVVLEDAEDDDVDDFSLSKGEEDDPRTSRKDNPLPPRIPWVAMSL